MQFFELNLDGLVGPSHHYAGLARGNLASIKNAQSLSNPKEAALQSLAKMRLLVKLGLKQAVMPPHQRPNLALLHQLGFGGTPSQQIEKAYREAPLLLSAVYSSSFMWTANAATVSSSLDTADHRVHFTAANLVSNLHRHQEADFTKTLLEKIFANEMFFVHHPLLPKSFFTADEGAANHSRLTASHDHSGLQLFVYGKKASQTNLKGGPQIFHARQTLEASEVIARQHLLSPSKILFACQNPKAIDKGVFHNDVIALANESLFLVHEQAFADQEKVLAALQNLADFPIQIIEVKNKTFSLVTAVKTYFFNSQLVTLPNKKEMAMIAPIECKENLKVKHFLGELVADKENPISELHFLNLRQSMRNGGGPACLRLRIPLSEQEFDAMHQGVIVTENLLDELELWVKRHYRDQLDASDLADPSLINEIFTALDELSQLLKLGSIYPFQES